MEFLCLTQNRIERQCSRIESLAVLSFFDHTQMLDLPPPPLDSCLTWLLEQRYTVAYTLLYDGPWKSVTEE